MCNVSLNGTQPSDASLRVLRALEAAGLEAWYVGGSVRDALMGCPSPVSYTHLTLPTT